MSHWIWFPGSFELYHGLLLHNRRTSARTVINEGKSERVSVYYFPMWRVDAPIPCAELCKSATLEKEEIIEFYSNTANAVIKVDGCSYPVGSKITLSPGEHNITVGGFKNESFPAFYVKGDVFASDRTWTVARPHDRAGRHAGQSELYTSVLDNVEVFKFSYKRLNPVSAERINGGVLFDFGKEVFGKFNLNSADDEALTVFLGESREEALDTDFSHLVLNVRMENGSYRSESVALRYAFVPNASPLLTAWLDFEYLPLENKGYFECDSEEINRIWDVCAYTMLLNSREGFFDGIKRDRWVWSGDAYQSYFVNYYLANDKEIVKRTVRMLRGADPITKHINTITDYTFYWIISIYEYYLYTADSDFVTDIYPEVLDIMKFVESRLDGEGMFERRADDWVFMDWSTFDSSGPICAEQLALARAYEALSQIALVNGDIDTSRDAVAHCEKIVKSVNERYWCEEKGALVDCYKSGKKNVTRHANIFALLFDYTTKERKDSIIKNVIYNEQIPPITTPYFEFYELEAMCRIGDFKYVTDMLSSYWGGMLRLGATTVWEEFDPTKSGTQHYEMYGGKYEKSLCHAWGASPIYLLGRYALGVSPTAPGYERYIVKPSLMTYKKIKGAVPTVRGSIRVEMDGETLSVFAPFDGGKLIINDTSYDILSNKELTICLRK